MGCPHRCDHRAASLSTVRTGRPPPLEPKLSFHNLQALLQGRPSSQPSTTQHGGPFCRRPVHRDAIQVCQCRMGITRGRPYLRFVSASRWDCSPLQGDSFHRKKRPRPAPPAVTARLQRTFVVFVQPYIQWFVVASNQQGGALGCTILSQTGSLTPAVLTGLQY